MRAWRKKCQSHEHSLKPEKPVLAETLCFDQVHAETATEENCQTQLEQQPTLQWVLLTKGAWELSARRF
ncbi:hypothetical protein AV530_000510 [Patagioenas fasciata monilis]|uniref:Uncharacterized protein n=1 Tax=Patagioenas fasciata monilis TaxID=372326 RepID=A0A1V4IFH8_PATFA|nr:hypothetical protein AV530_000510 [Patagioenas fasciata monilis]